ncbi:MAG TPA: uroporphyrinogen-III synthase [Acetobacteraceae bacterium]|nr:uroporphyrinogen-III synthase [Acetobacteraceae bacterium]
MPEPPDSTIGSDRDAILITRPEPGATDTAGRVAALGFTPVLCPVLAIRQVAATLPPALRIGAVLVTSRNAIASLPVTYHPVPLLAVGNATADHARQAGFAQVFSADGDAQALSHAVRQQVNPAAGALLLATGRHNGGELAQQMRQAGYRVLRRVVYSAEPRETLEPEAVAALDQGRIRSALFFSAETARHFVNLVRPFPLMASLRAVDAVAIGQAAGMALEALPWRRVRVAARPNQDEMLALL